MQPGGPWGAPPLRRGLPSLRRKRGGGIRSRRADTCLGGGRDRRFRHARDEICHAECDDGMSISCTESCAGVGRAGPNRLFIKLTASQAFSPLVPWPGIPASLSATTEIRLR